MDALIQQFFNLDIMSRALPLVLQGLWQTVVLCLIVIPLGLIGGLLFALVSLARSRTVRYAMIVAIDFFRAVPPLVLLIFIYSGLPFAGIRLSPLTAVALAFFLNTSSSTVPGSRAWGAASGMRRAPPGSTPSTPLPR
jgi:polar amino acid transport system permease protein